MLVDVQIVPSFFLSLAALFHAARAPWGFSIAALTSLDHGYCSYVYRMWSPWRRQCTPLQSSCLENPMDGGAWWAAVHGVTKSPAWLSEFTFTFYFHALEKAMATHSSVLAWRIPGTGEPGGLPSLGSHRVGHEWSDLAAAAAAAAACDLPGQIVFSEKKKGGGHSNICRSTYSFRTWRVFHQKVESNFSPLEYGWAFVDAMNRKNVEKRCCVT